MSFSSSCPYIFFLKKGLFLQKKTKREFLSKSYQKLMNGQIFKIEFSKCFLIKLSQKLLKGEISKLRFLKGILIKLPYFSPKTNIQILERWIELMLQ